MNKTPIEWTDYTWNPITGCLRGCSYCYARRISHRFKRDFTPQLHEDRLDDPAKLKKPSKIFVCSMGDLFGVGVRPEWQADVYDAMFDAPWHTYQLLTKLPERCDPAVPYRAWKSGTAVWMGATATDQASWDFACQQLQRLPTDVVRYISAEPMLGYIRPKGWLPDWVVIGALTGHGAQNRVDSARRGFHLASFLAAHKVPIFEKDSLSRVEPTRRWPG